MPKKMVWHLVCLFQAFNSGFEIRILELEAFRLNVGNLTTEYQYAVALKGIPFE